MSKSLPLHYKVADRLINLMSKGTHGHTMQETMDGTNYIQTYSEHKGFYISQEITIIDITIYDDLKLNAIKLLIQIQQELKINNPIWECTEMHKSEVRAGLAQLKEKDILESVNENLFIVNPEKIRRGKPLACLAALYQYSKRKWEQDKSWRISSDDIKKFSNPGDNIEIKQLQN